MNSQIKDTMLMFYSNPEGWSTDEVYSEYLNICSEDGVEPRTKSSVIREICKEYNCVLREVRTKYFVGGGVNDRTIK